MTIQEIANRLNKCALMECKGCKYFKGNEVNQNYVSCQAQMIGRMALECKQIADELVDDGK